MEQCLLARLPLELPDLIFESLLVDESPSVHEKIHRCTNGMRNFMLANKAFTLRFGTYERTRESIHKLQNELAARQEEKNIDYEATNKRKIKHPTRIDIPRIAQLLNTPNSALICIEFLFGKIDTNPERSHRLVRQWYNDYMTTKKISFLEKYIEAYKSLAHDPKAKNHFILIFNQILCQTGKYNQTELAKQLLDVGCNVNARDTQGATVLWYAVQHSKDPIFIAMLLQAGADVTIRKPITQTTPLSMARKHITDPHLLFMIEAAAPQKPKKDFFSSLFA